MVGEAVAIDHVQHGECERGIAPGTGLKMEVRVLRGSRPDRIDHDHLRTGLQQPVVVLMGSRHRGVGAPHHDDFACLGRPRIKPLLRVAVGVVQCNVSGLVADGVGVDLGGAQPREEALGEEEGEHGEGARVVGVEDRAGPQAIGDVGQPRGDLVKRLLPGHGLEAA